MQKLFNTILYTKADFHGLHGDIIVIIYFLNPWVYEILEQMLRWDLLFGGCLLNGTTSVMTSL